MSRDLSKHLEQFTFRVDEDESGLRLDHVLASHIHWRSRTDLQKRIRGGKIVVNHQAAKASTRLDEGDEVTVFVNKEDLPDQDPASIDIEILFEDEAVIVVNKQPGLIVHPTGRHVYDTLMNALFLRYRRSGQLDHGVSPQVVHRLDRNTSGVLLVAKTAAAKQFLQGEFEARRPRKRYVGLVEGIVEQDAGDIDAPIARDFEGKIRLRMKIDPDGAESRTSFKVLERYDDASLLQFYLHTGRQHQIRVHAQHMGHALLADPLYGDPHDVGFHGENSAVVTRQALHAEFLEIKLPGSASTTSFLAPLPGDMMNLIKGMRKGLRLTRLDDNQSSTWS